MLKGVSMTIAPRRRAFLAGIALFGFTGVLLAQSDRGTITGSVTDPSSAAVAGATVEARNLDNGSVLAASTTSAGAFTISSVPVGKYSVTVSAIGFKTFVQNGVQVLLDQTV